MRHGVWLALICLLWPALAVQAEELRGTALKIFDGDSFILQLDGSGKKLDVRLAEIDAPEKDQPYANESRAALNELIFRRKLKAVVLDTDSYKRKIVRLYRVDDGLNINATLVERGHAWVYRRWVRDKTLFDREKTAKQQRLGLWALPEAQRTPPWKWRYEHRKERAPLPEAAGVHSPAHPAGTPLGQVGGTNEFFATAWRRSTFAIA